MTDPATLVQDVFDKDPMVRAFSVGKITRQLYTLNNEEKIGKTTIKLLKGFYTNNKFEIEPDIYPSKSPDINIERG